MIRSKRDFENLTKLPLEGFSETEDDDGERDHESVKKNQEPEIKSPISLKLAKVAIWWLLIRNFKIPSSSRS